MLRWPTTYLQSMKT